MFLDTHTHKHIRNVIEDKFILKNEIICMGYGWGFNIQVEGLLLNFLLQQMGPFKKIIKNKIFSSVICKDC